MNTPYRKVDTADPHVFRREKILNEVPEIKKLMGHDIREFWITVAFVSVQFLLAWIISKYFSDFTNDWWVVLLISFFLGGVLNHWAGMAIHECCHDLMAPKAWQNKLIAIFANSIMVVPVAMPYRREHLRHHTYIGVEGIDRDIPTHMEARFARGIWYKKLIWVLFMVFFIVFTRIKRQRLTPWVTGNIIFIVFIDLVILYFWGPVTLFYLFMSTFWGFGIHPAAAHYIHEHFITTEGQETYSYYGPLNKVGFNIGYHNEHHDWMNIPGIRLPEYRRITKEYYLGLEECTSWTRALIRFIFSDNIGADSKYVREKEIIEKSKKVARSISG